MEPTTFLVAVIIGYLCGAATAYYILRNKMTTSETAIFCVLLLFLQVALYWFRICS